MSGLVLMDKKDNVADSKNKVLEEMRRLRVLQLHKLNLFQNEAQSFYFKPNHCQQYVGRICVNPSQNALLQLLPALYRLQMHHITLIALKNKEKTRFV